MESITSLGVASGLDLSGLVDQLVDSERAASQSLLNVKEATALSKLSALGLVKGTFGAFESVLEPLTTLSSFQGRTITTTNDEAITGTADSKAAAGRYNVEIQSLAAQHKLRSAAFTDTESPVGNGTLTFSSGAESFAVAIDAETSSLADIRDAINNAEQNTTVQASIVNSDEGAHLVFSAAFSGADLAIQIQSSGGDGGLSQFDFAAEQPSAVTEVQAAADATVLIDGLTVTSKTNVVVDAIEGVTLNLIAAEVGNTLEVNVGYDTDGAKEKIEQFVQGYNNILQTLKGQTSFNADTLSAGPLLGDSAIRNISNELRNTVGGFTSDFSNPLGALANIGITTTVDGELTIDNEVLDEALSASFDDVGRLFSGDTGVATLANGLMERFTSDTGPLETRSDSLQARIDDISDRREVIEQRIELFEARTRAQFTALDALIGELNSTSNFLGQQLANLPGNNQN